MSDDESKIGPPPKEGVYFRAFIGILALVAAIGGLAGLYFVQVPMTNRDALMLALGVVLQWGGNVVSSEYGATTTGRKAAEAMFDKQKSAK